MVSVVNAAFYKEQSVIDFIKELLNKSDADLNKPLAPFEKKKVTSSLKKLKVMTKNSIHGMTSYEI